MDSERDHRPGLARATSSTPPVAGVPEDQQLVSAILRSDRKATAQFVALHADAVYSYIRQRLAPRADLVDDVVQEVFVAALLSLASFQGASSLRSWLLGIARHKVEDYYRERLRQPEPLDEAGEVDLVAVSQPMEEAIDRRRLEAKTQGLLRELPENYAVVLLWRYWEGRSVRDIASAAGKTEKSVERLLARARAHFRALWERS
jgi:RNA polymerase sigma-70 factor (ECF subfamily)